MSLHWVGMAIIALAVVVGIVRTLRFRGKRKWLLASGQLLMAGSLALLLYPPSFPRDLEQAVVLTAGTTASQLENMESDATLIVLPEASLEIDQNPAAADLGSALREHPEVGSLKILGDGLPARDRGVLSNLGVAFEPAEVPTGIVELQVPDAVSLGTRWLVSGRVAGINNARLELVDRSDAVVASAMMDEDGRFRLSTVAKSGTRMLYRLRVLDADDAVIEEIPVAIAVRQGDSLRVLVVAGAPDAELKYLRRWIVDAGHALGSQITLSRGIEQRQSSTRLDPETLANTDLLVTDERAWSGLSRSTRDSVSEAIESGMGLLLRVTGPVPDSVAEDWAAMGFRLEAADVARSVGVDEISAGLKESRIFTRRPLAITGPDSVPLLKGEDESDLVRWRAMGQGRVGIWLPLDSWRMTLDGDSEAYGTLWSEVLATLARARSVDSPTLPKLARIHQRSVVCGLDSGAMIEGEDGVRHELLVDEDGQSCAAWWPSESGWHELTTGDGRWPVHVLGQGEAVALQRMETREATKALVRDESPNARRVSAELPRWPFFLIWLGITALFWWLERRNGKQRE